jgi:hypothetical protein
LVGEPHLLSIIGLLFLSSLGWLFGQKFVFENFRSYP